MITYTRIGAYEAALSDLLRDLYVHKTIPREGPIYNVVREWLNGVANLYTYSEDNNLPF